jgi:hypothetical protein
MKKLFILMVFLAFTLNVIGQHTTSTITFLPNETYKTVTLTAADSIHRGGTSYWRFALNKPKTQYFAFAVELDTIGAVGAHVWVDVLGSIDGTTYVTTGATQVKYGATVDSTFSLVDVSTGVLWRYLKLQLVSKTQTYYGSLIKAISVKIGDK